MTDGMGSYNFHKRKGNLALSVFKMLVASPVGAEVFWRERERLPSHISQKLDAAYPEILKHPVPLGGVASGSCIWHQIPIEL